MYFAIFTEIDQFFEKIEYNSVFFEKSCLQNSKIFLFTILPAIILENIKREKFFC